MKQPPSGSPTTQARQRPAHEQLLGSIKSTFWKNETAHGVRYNAAFSRLFKDGEAWKESQSFGRDDLLVLAKAADQAHSWICEQMAQDRDTESEEDLNGEAAVAQGA